MYNIVDQLNKLNRYISCKTNINSEESEYFYFKVFFYQFGMLQKIASDQDP